MNCPQCNAQTVPGAMFCDNCGANLQQATPPQMPPQASAGAGGGNKCPACGAVNTAGAIFCENCGTNLQSQAQPNPQPQYTPQPQYQPPQPPPYVPPQPQVGGGYVVGRLVIQETNISLSIPPNKSEIFIGREDSVSSVFPEIDLERHNGMDKGVGRKHVKLIAQGNQIYVEDLNSVNGTFLKGQKLLSGQRYLLNPGDELILGKLKLTYYAS